MSDDELKALAERLIAAADNIRPMSPDPIRDIQKRMGAFIDLCHPASINSLATALLARLSQPTERLGAQGKLTAALRKLAITITNVSINPDGIKRVHYCAICSMRWLNDDERHEPDCVLTAPSKAGEPQGWMPIETAPKDGMDRDILAWSRWGGYLLAATENGKTFYSNDKQIAQPTHWQPLPSPPVQGAEETK